MKDKKEDFEKIGNEKVDADNKTLSALEEENSDLKNKIKRERFTWVFLLI